MFQLSKAGQIYLLELSRKTIQEFFQFGRRPSDVPTENELLEKRAVFVTLTSRGHLRGCVGYVTPLFPLYEGVINCSVSAATDDPRFQPLNFDELEHIEIEISVLSSMKAVKEVGQIEIGTHGLLISHKGRRGLLLPQVPVEHGWDRERFLSETCRKAGLPLDSWEKGALIEFFTATVFGEKDLDRPSMAATDEF
jgi:AmmeMemoRadiSam system protein A